MGKQEFRRFPGETEDEHRRRLQAMYGEMVGTSGPASTNLGTAPVPMIPARDPGPSVGAPQGTLVDPRALALSINPAEELERIRSRPPETFTDMAARAFTEGGERPNFMGLEDEFGFKRDARAARARELYGQTPSEPSSRWEDEFVADRKRYTDADIQRSFMLQSLMHGQDAGLKFREMARGEQKGYDEGLQAARAQDAAHQRVSPALAEAIAGSGMASPEAAVALRMNDPLVKAFTSGGYSQGLRAEGQNLGYVKNLHDNMVKLSQGAANRQANAENTVMRGVLGIQAALANKGVITADTSVPDATKAELAVSRLMRRIPEITPEQAVDVLQGNTANLPPEIQRKVQMALPEVKRTVNDPVATRSVVVGQEKVEGEAQAREQNAVSQFIAKAKADPKYAYDQQKAFVADAMKLNAAMRAWQTMSPEGKEAFVQFAPTGIPAKLGEFVKHLGMNNAQRVTEDDRVKAMAVRQIINELVQKRSGVAVTDSEWGRTSLEVGLGNGSWDPINSPKGVSDYLMRAGQVMRAHRDEYNRLIGWK